jgi:hypothetical protein
VPIGAGCGRPGGKCQAGPGRVVGGAYEIAGQQLTDYWFYVRGRWVFDLVLSNPDAVKLYRLSAQQYVAALGCSH